MKKRLVYTVLAGILFCVFRYIKGRTPMLAAILITPPLTFATFFLMCGLPMVVFWNLYSLPRLIKAHGKMGWIPLLLSIAFFALSGYVSDFAFDQRMKEITQRLPEYQSVVDKAIEETLQSGNSENIKKLEEGGLWIGRKTRDDGLGYAVIVERKSSGLITARFLQSVTFNSHHAKVLYRSDGDIKSALRVREGVQGQISDKWWAIGD